MLFILRHFSPVTDNTTSHYPRYRYKAMKLYNWTLDQNVLVSTLYAFAIITGVFRLSYRWYTSRFWWEDVWAMVALLLNIICLVCEWMLQSRRLVAATWMEAAALASGLWATRMSMITTIIRITSHHVLFKRSAYATAIAFGMMWVATLALKLYDCDTSTCDVDQHLVASQLVTDVISDTLLLVLPLCFLRGVEIERGQRVLLVSSFASSICITIISITHSVFILLPHDGTSLILAHIKTALALIICNLLVIVTLIYRLCHRNSLDLDGVPTKSDGIQFTSIIPTQWSLSTGVLHPTSSSGTSRHQPPSALDVDTPRS